jgi:formamidopyrimidine-DNA glycosylase
MPELPDITLYLHALEARVAGRPLERVRLASPFLVRTVDPPLTSLHGQVVRRLRRVGKRIVFEFDGPRFLVLHLMIAGRLRWQPAGAALTGRMSLAAFDFPDGTLVLTEAGSKKRASVHVIDGEQALADHDPGGLEVLDASREAFAARLAGERRTLKRAMTDPRVFSGIGNAYSDEILHAARLSPLQLTTNLTGEEVDRLHHAVQDVLTLWIERLRQQAGESFPDKVTAFREQMAVHGRFGKPCPRCGAAVQRIVYANNECNYCPVCQTEGRLLADRSLSRLLGKDWPRTLEELEELKRR